MKDLYKEKIYLYYKESADDDEIANVMEELDAWNGFLGDDRVEPMEYLNEFYCNTDPIDILYRAYYGRDDDTWTTNAHGEKEYGEFNPNREYFYFNGYGNLVSTDYRDYSSHLDYYFVDKLIEEANNLYEISDEVRELINAYNESEDE